MIALVQSCKALRGASFYFIVKLTHCIYYTPDKLIAESLSGEWPHSMPLYYADRLFGAVYIGLKIGSRTSIVSNRRLGDKMRSNLNPK